MDKKIIIASQRVDTIVSYGEVRDALDEKWSMLLQKMGYVLLPLPNHEESVKVLVESVSVHGILLTGGNNPTAYGGDAKQRDLVDEFLIQLSMNRKLPLVGVCRGMQSIGMHFGCKLERIEHHVAVTHKVRGMINREVNSYHNYAIKQVSNPLIVEAKGIDGSIEAVRHEHLPIFGMMWHPERCEPFDKADIELLKGVWK